MTKVSLDTETVVILMILAAMLTICIAYGLIQINETLGEIRDRLPAPVVEEVLEKF